MLSASAGLASLRGEWERAARFIGASDRQLELMGMCREPADEAALAPLIANAGHQCGVERFRAAQASGRLLDGEDLVAELHRFIEGLP